PLVFALAVALPLVGAIFFLSPLRRLLFVLPIEPLLLLLRRFAFGVFALLIALVFLTALFLALLLAPILLALFLVIPLVALVFYGPLLLDDVLVDRQRGPVRNARRTDEQRARAREHGFLHRPTLPRIGSARTVAGHAARRQEEKRVYSVKSLPNNGMLRSRAPR